LPLSGSDCPGILAARRIGKQHLPGVKVFIAGMVPESMTGPVRKFRPDHVLFLDAAEMRAPPGSIRIIRPSRIEANLVSTHVLPLTVLMDFIAKDTGAKVTLLGIQPVIPGESTGQGIFAKEILDRNLAEVLRALVAIISGSQTYPGLW